MKPIWRIWFCTCRSGNLGCQIPTKVAQLSAGVSSRLAQFFRGYSSTLISCLGLFAWFLKIRLLICVPVPLIQFARRVIIALFLGCLSSLGSNSPLPAFQASWGSICTSVWRDLRVASCGSRSRERIFGAISFTPLSVCTFQFGFDRLFAFTNWWTLLSRSGGSCR